MDLRDPTRGEWRGGDSSWSLVTEDELARLNREIQGMPADGSMDRFLVEGEERGCEHGQGTIAIGRKPLTG